MYPLMRNAELRKELLVEVPSLILAMVSAELFYKFHSFTLECATFLATWLALSYLVRLFMAVWLQRQKVAAAPEDNGPVNPTG